MLYPEKLKDNEYIALFFMGTDRAVDVAINQNNRKIEFHKYVKDFVEYQSCINQFKFNFHVYNALATVKIGEDGKLHRRESNMGQQRVLFIDFDKKDYPELKDAYDFTKMIKSKLPDVFLHAYYDSGHGYHYYIMVPPTYNIKELSELNREVSSLVGADTNACKITQVARVPYTYNRKNPDMDGKYPFVKEIDHYKKHPNLVARFHPLDTENLRRTVRNAKKQSGAEKRMGLPLTEWKYSANGFDINQYSCFCTEKVFHEGADIHERNTWLGRIIVWLKNKGYLDFKIEQMCQEWNARCRPPKDINEIQDEIRGWNKWIREHGMAIGGCWWNMRDNRVSEMVCKQCDKFHCKQAINPYDGISILGDKGVKLSGKVLTGGKLSTKGKNVMTGYEYLILAVLSKYMPKKDKTPFTVKDLKYRMQWRNKGKWQLCMDITTLKKTLESLEHHKCVSLSDPATAQSKKKSLLYGDKIIHLTRGIKDIETKGYIEFYYSAARALICHQITQSEYKVYLCILNNLKNHKSCTLEKLGIALDMGERNVLRAVKSLESASLLRVDHVMSIDRGKRHNIYCPIDTNRWDQDTDIELDERKTECKISFIT